MDCSEALERAERNRRCARDPRWRAFSNGFLIGRFQFMRSSANAGDSAGGGGRGRRSAGGMRVEFGDRFAILAEGEDLTDAARSLACYIFQTEDSSEAGSAMTSR
jgi:hypothetical protein